MKKWLSKDPIGESGGKNLYGFVINDPINYYDALGTFPYYRNWGGPNWTGGQKKSWDELPESERERLLHEKDPKKGGPIDARDNCYKKHDICYGECKMKKCISDKKYHNCVLSCDKKLAACLKLLIRNGDIKPNKWNFDAAYIYWENGLGANFYK